MAALRLSLPSLEKLIILCKDGIYPVETRNLRLFSSAPRLQSLEVIDLVDPEKRFKLPWSQVEDILQRPRHISLSTLTDILALVRIII